MVPEQGKKQVLRGHLLCKAAGREASRPRSGSTEMKQDQAPRRIASFSVDHDYITPGVYISRADGDITTYDLRTRRPNAGAYMDNVTMHTVEHLFATYVRSSEIGERVIYFGPMGCRTGFYLLVRDTAPSEVYRVIRLVLQKIIAHEGEVFGASRTECGNYLELELASAKRECEAYFKALPESKTDFSYPCGK